ncbi:glycosyltransferase [Paenibacillus ihuae]|uniref:glycosyltransferase n=1 Tax=Paenibacillus ihuae TaxID=1232431 RepID=UPI0006D579AD|nr:glycosyltransferase [Paenibacillus ihuae]
MNPIRVLVLTRLFPNDTNRVKGIFVENLVDKQAEQENYHFTVLAPVPYSNKLLSRISGKFRQWYGHSREAGRPGYTVYYPKYLKLPLLYPLEWLFMLISVWLFIKRNKMEFDIVHTHWLYPDGTAAILLAKLLGIRVVVHNHEAQMSFHTDRRIIRWYLNKLLKIADVIIPVSQSAESELLKSVRLPADSVRTKIIYNGVNLSKLNIIDSRSARALLGLDQDVLHFMTIGTLNYKKGQDILIEALGLLKQNRPELRFHWHVLGEGSEREVYRELIIRHHIEQETTIYGNVDYDQVGLYMCACDYFMLTSRHESFGIVFLEALICGKPVLGSKTGGVPEFVDSSSGILVNVNDMMDTYQGILQLLSTKWDGESIRLFYKKHFDLSVFADEINELYASLLYAKPIRSWGGIKNNDIEG